MDGTEVELLQCKKCRFISRCLYGNQNRCLETYIANSYSGHLVQLRYECVYSHNHQNSSHVRQMKERDRGFSVTVVVCRETEREGGSARPLQRGKRVIPFPIYRHHSSSSKQAGVRYKCNRQQRGLSSQPRTLSSPYFTGMFALHSFCL